MDLQYFTCCSPPKQAQLCAVGGDLWRGEKAISGQTPGEEGEGGGRGGKKDLKESGRKAEGSDTDREKMFNLAPCSAETLNLLQSLWKVKAGWRRVWGVGLTRWRNHKYPTKGLRVLSSGPLGPHGCSSNAVLQCCRRGSTYFYPKKKKSKSKNTNVKVSGLRLAHPIKKFNVVSHTETDSAEWKNLLSCGHGPSVKNFILAAILMTINSQLTANSPVKSHLEGNLTVINKVAFLLLLTGSSPFAPNLCAGMFVDRYSMRKSQGTRSTRHYSCSFHSLNESLNSCRFHYGVREA